MLPFGYCPTRKLLEDRAWLSVERFSVGALYLIGLVGDSAAKFLAAQCECAEAKAFSSEARWELDCHRLGHKC
jgi:hypothetical protein